MEILAENATYYLDYEAKTREKRISVFLQREIPKRTKSRIFCLIFLYFIGIIYFRNVAIQ